MAFLQITPQDYVHGAMSEQCLLCLKLLGYSSMRLSAEKKELRIGHEHAMVLCSKDRVRAEAWSRG